MTIKCLALVVDVQQKNGSMLAHWGSPKNSLHGAVSDAMFVLWAQGERLPFNSLWPSENGNLTVSWSEGD